MKTSIIFLSLMIFEVLVFLLVWLRSDIKLQHWIISKTPNFLVPFSVSGRHSRDGIYLYEKGTTLVLKDRRMWGYGVRPVGKIVGFEKDHRGEEFYLVEMEKYVNMDFFDHMKTGLLKGTPRREKRLEKHFKLNIEWCFIPA